ncbi:hypothetical protein XENOCAPTIV_018369 [Xenoophorus captivus]|uniref:Uncharacterized protein n=1 Tax=Xenoophorus captivus TaxID=1517983 RepID=A0ABV0QX50_9TELE
MPCQPSSWRPSCSDPFAFYFQKRKAADHSEMKPKRLRADKNQNFTVSDDRTTASDPVDMQSELHTVRLFEFAVSPSQQRETGLMESSDSSLQTEMNSQVSVDGAKPGVNFPLTLYQTVDDLMNTEGSAEVVMMSESSAEDGQVELVNGITAALLSQGGTLVLNELMLGCTEQRVAPPRVQDLISTTEDFLQVHDSQEVVAYFETIPNVLPSGTSTQFTFPSDTLLSSALSSKPISSTLPIVSKHVPPSSLVLTLERLDRDEGEEGEGEGEGMSEPDETEQENHQLEEHCYHKNSLSKEQLEAIVAALQKKVKVLQQRHRRHLEKLLGLENTVSQLRQSNILNEERLQLLERVFIQPCFYISSQVAISTVNVNILSYLFPLPLPQAYLQTSAAASDAGETVAIIYEEDDSAYFYTPLNNAGTLSNVDDK